MTTINGTSREVYLSVCQTIAAFYEPLGFKYSPSGQHLRLKSKDNEFIFQISFSSSHFNDIDNVKFEVCANVLSHKFKKWQSQNQIGEFNKKPCEYIAGGNIGNLQEAHKYKTWNVANPATRDAMIEDIVLNINTLAMPFFESFKQLNTLIADIESKGEYFAIHDINRLATFLSYVASKETVERTFSNFLTNKASWNDYFKVLATLKLKGKLSERGYLSDLARLTLELNLDLTDKNEHTI
jgi:Domain of unknown function (DUF4304)